MTLQLFLNDLSIPDEECALDEAVARLRGLLSTLRAIGRVRPGYQLNADRPFAEMALARGRPLAALRNEPSCIDERVFLKTIADRSPWTDALAARPPDAAGGAEYRMPGDAPVAAGADATGLGLAHDLDGLGISLPTHAHWDQTFIDVVRITLDDDAQQAEVTIHARNASCGRHVGAHAAALAAAALPPVHDGHDLWARRAELLPNLRFVPTARGAIEALPHRDPNLAGAVERLLELDRAVGEWAQNGMAHPCYPFSVVPESRSRIRDGLADINDGAGTIRTFSDHARYGPDENRIHFILETEPQRHALVGHVGRKLGIG